MSSPVYSQQPFDVGPYRKQALTVGDIGPVGITFLEVAIHPPDKVISLAFNPPVVADPCHFLLYICWMKCGGIWVIIEDQASEVLCNQTQVELVLQGEHEKAQGSHIFMLSIKAKYLENTILR